MRRLPLYSVSASPPSFASQSYRLFYFNRPLSLLRYTVHPPPFDLRFANCQLNDGCNSAICISDYSSPLRALSVHAPFVCSFSSIIPVNDLIGRHAASNEERF